MDDRVVATVLVRNRGELLLFRRNDTAGSYPGRWDGVTGRAGDSPADAATRELHRLTGTDTAQTDRLRAGGSVTVEDTDRDCRRVVHPFLFDCQTRDVVPDHADGRTEWVPPPAVHDRVTVPGLWAAYDRVRPTVEDIATDSEHGSTTLSVRALELLRDEAGLAARGEVPAGDDRFEHVASLARDLLAARPSMTAVVNRVSRALSRADRTATAVEQAAHAAVGRALRADREAAATAADLLAGDRVATLSRSGTVLQTLDAAAPEAVLVAESRPGREGVDVAAALADETSVTLTTDAGFAHALATRDVDTLLVGADSILADGRVLNKVGTRGAAVAAAREGLQVLVAAASDKVRPGTDYDLEERPRTELSGGVGGDIEVVNPTFDVTPAGAVDAVATERGPLDSAAVRAVATDHQRLRAWDDGPE